METTAVPLITDRLRLRPLQQSESSILHRHWTEPGVRRYLWDGHAVPESQAEEAIRRSDDLFTDYGAGLWSVRRRDHTELIGCAGFWPYHEPPQLELLVSLSEDQWGQGFALEAAEVLLRFVFVSLGWGFVQASADAPNESSLRLIKRLGMSPFGSTVGEFGTIEIYRLTREEWFDRVVHVEVEPSAR